jgi:nucleotide-binding universal stress UspA family protein
MGQEQSAPVRIVAGVYPGQSPAVAQEAAMLAAALHGELVCAYVNPGRYPVAESPDGGIDSAPVDPDFEDDADASFPSGLATALAGQLDALGTAWRPVLLAGDVADALAHCADTLDAALIVVGTHGDSRTTLREVFAHSVATRLARRQLRPVLVVPTHHGHPGPAVRHTAGHP